MLFNLDLKSVGNCIFYGKGYELKSFESKVQEIPLAKTRGTNVAMALKNSFGDTYKQHFIHSVKEANNIFMMQIRLIGIGIV